MAFFFPPPFRLQRVFPAFFFAALFVALVGSLFFSIHLLVGGFLIPSLFLLLGHDRSCLFFNPEDPSFPWISPPSIPPVFSCENARFPSFYHSFSLFPQRVKSLPFFLFFFFSPRFSSCDGAPLFPRNSPSSLC